VSPSAAALLAWRAQCADWCLWGARPEAAGVFAVERRAGVVCAWSLDAATNVQDNLWVDEAGAADPDTLLDAVGTLRRDRGTIDLRLPPAGARRWTVAALRRGYRLAEVNPLMVCEQSAAGDLPAGAEVRQAGGDADYEAALATVEVSFGGPRRLTRFFAPRGACRVYLALQDGVPAAAACATPSPGRVDIYSVSTRPEYRRRGLARGLLLHLLASERALGGAVAGLRTVDALVPFYERLGFRVVGRTARLRHSPWC